MKNPFKNISPEVKGALLVSSLSLLLFSSLAGFGILVSRSNQDEPVAISPSSSISIYNSSSSSSSTISQIEKEVFKIEKPFKEDCSYLHYFFDISYDIDDPKLSKALLEYEGCTHQSRGVDFIFGQDEEFMVYNSYPGIVKAIVRNDRVFENIIKIESNDGLTFIYAGIKDIEVKVNQEVKSMETIGTSGPTSFSEKYNNSLHFEIMKDGKYINPEKAFGKQSEEL